MRGKFDASFFSSRDVGDAVPYKSRRVLQGCRPIEPVFPRPLGEGQGEGIKLIPHFVQTGTSAPRGLGVLRKDAVPYKSRRVLQGCHFTQIFQSGRRGRRPLHKNRSRMSRTPSPTKYSACFARTPSPTSILSIFQSTSA